MTLKLKEADFDNCNWRVLGHELGLRQGTLNVIETNYPRDTNRCHDECLIKWLQRADDVDTCHGVPTYSSLADALDSIDQKNVVDKIRKYYYLTIISNVNYEPFVIGESTGQPTEAKLPIINTCK